jgi:subtilisin family serine protease
MAQSGFTPISLYYSTTASTVPTAGNLVAGELAINTADGKLYFKNSSNVVTLLADSTSASGTLINPTITNYTESVVTIGTVTTAHTLSLTNGTVQTATLTTAVGCTFTMPTATAGKSFILRITQAALGLGTATFTGVKWAGGTAPTITATANAVDMLSFVSVGSVWYGSAIQNLS